MGGRQGYGGDTWVQQGYGGLRGDAEACGVWGDIRGLGGIGGGETGVLGVPPAESHEALLDDVALGLGEGAAAGEAVDGVQHGVHHDGAVLGAGEERGALGDERQHRQAQVPVQRQRHLRRAEGGLVAGAVWAEGVRTPWGRGIPPTHPTEGPSGKGMPWGRADLGDPISIPQGRFRGLNIHRIRQGRLGDPISIA